MTEERKPLREARQWMVSNEKHAGACPAQVMGVWGRCRCGFVSLIGRIDALLATEPEPVAWMYHDGESPDKPPSPLAGSTLLSFERMPNYRNERPLYAVPQGQEPEKILAGWYDLDYEVSWGKVKPMVAGTWKPLYIERAAIQE
jgi:hypothetical protein